MTKKPEESAPKKEKKTVKKTPEPKKKKPEKEPENTEEKKTSTKFQKGHDKVGGRKAGTPNKCGNIRDRLKAIIMPYLETNPDNMTPGVPTFATDIIKISDPKDRADVLSKYLPFVVPKYSSTTITADANRPINEEEELMELDKAYTKKELTLTLHQVTIVDNDKSTLPPPPSLTDFDPDEEDDWDADDLK